MKKITKAVFPVAGLGTRFLPATKAIPKEMLPIIDKPLIEYAVEEAVNAGIKEFFFITNHTIRAIEDHFDQNFELEEKLIKSGNKDAIKKITPDNFYSILSRQKWTPLNPTKFERAFGVGSENIPTYEEEIEYYLSEMGRIE